METTNLRRSIRSAMWLLLTVGLASTPAWAQNPRPAQPTELSNLTLEQLAELKIDSVFGASRYNQKVTQAPSSITIVSAEEIQRYGHRTLADILRSVRGFYVTNDRNYSYLGVRGFARPGDYNSRVLLLVDGHRLNDNIFGAALIGTEFPMDIDLIDRVEIIRGPSSSLYGTSAFMAVINVITRRGDALKGIEATGLVGTQATRKGRVSVGRRFDNGVEMLLSGSAYTSDGQRRLYFEEFDSPASNNGVAENADGDDFRNAFGKFAFGHLTVHGLYGARDKAIPTASFGTVFNDPRSRTVERQGFVDVQYDRTFATGWNVGARAYLDHYSYDGDYVFDHAEDATPVPVINRDFARGNWFGVELGGTKTFQPRHTVAFGAEYRSNFRQDQLNYAEEPYLLHLDDQRNSTSWALYIQDEVTLHRMLRVNVGLRHDSYDTFGNTTNPRVGVIYNPTSETSVKLLYGQAFRAPNAYELFWGQQGVAKSNPLLKAETNKTTELVIEHYIGPRLRLTATGFHYSIRGLITQQTDPKDGLLVYNNIGAIRAKGAEVEVEGKWPTGVRGRVGYTYEDSRNDATGLGLTNSPHHLAKANLMAPLAENRVLAGFELQYVGARQTVLGGEVPGVWIPNLTLQSKLPHRLELSASLYNLVNHQYGDPGSEEHRQDTIRQDGRTVWIKVTYRLPR